MSLDKHLENVIKETENNTKKLAPLLPEHKPRYPLGTHRSASIIGLQCMQFSSCSERDANGMR